MVCKMSYFGPRISRLDEVDRRYTKCNNNIVSQFSFEYLEHSVYGMPWMACL